jgi:hypothetical protein
MVNSVQTEVDIPCNSVVGEVTLGVKQKSVQQVFRQRERKYTYQQDRQSGKNTHATPIHKTQEIDQNTSVEGQNVIPLVMAEHFQEPLLEHARRLDEEPVGRVDEGDIFRVV